MAKKLLFVGAGAIGSYLGSFLSRAGHDVTIVDPWAEQVDTINAHGIKVTGPHDPFTAPESLTGLTMDLRVRVSDVKGGALTQTTYRAFLVGP